MYVDDFLAVGPRQVLQALLTQLLHVWKGSNPDFLGREPDDVDTLRLLGLDIGLVETRRHMACTSVELHTCLPPRDVRRVPEG